MKKLSVLVYGDIGGSGGYVRYCKGLFGSKSIPKHIDITFVCSPEFYQMLIPLDPEVKVILNAWMSSSFRILRYLWHLFVYPLMVYRIKPDIEFYPSGNRRVLFRKAVSVVTCHNLLPFDQGELCKISSMKELKYLNAVRRRQTRSFQRSNGVIFLSEFSRQIVCKQIFHINNSTVISHGIDDYYRIDIQRNYHLNKTVNILYVSPIYQYKHQLEVIKAIKIARNITNIDFRIKIIGGYKSSQVINIRNTVKSEGLDDYVFIADEMKHGDLLDEYRSADIFVFASSCETFGITLLEAMGAKLPIACSLRTGLQNILKDGGVYFDPDDPQSIAISIITLASNYEVRRNCGNLAYKYSLEYKWADCSRNTFQYLNDIYTS